jgi:GTP-binding protein YchF
MAPERSQAQKLAELCYLMPPSTFMVEARRFEMEVGIMGLTASGKSTVFGLLTGQDAAARHGIIQVGIAKVPDDRLEALSSMYQPEKTTPATVRYVDVPGIPEEHRREAAFNLPELRAVDALMVVLRAFTNDAVAHPMGSIDSLRDLRHIEQEFILQDLLIIEKRLERVRKDLGKRQMPELEREAALLERCQEVLENERPLREESFDENEAKILRGFTFLSMKPMLVVLNVGEDQMADEAYSDSGWAEWTKRPHMAFTRVCATLENELTQVEGTDAQVFMAEFGIEDRALDRVIRESYRLLGSISFFTVGSDECRAWSIRTSTPAVEAGGVIHSDIQRGFIRAEVVPHDDLLEAGSLAACRQLGTLRLEGKTYPVRDGEVVHFRFNV